MGSQQGNPRKGKGFNNKPGGLQGSFSCTSCHASGLSSGWERSCAEKAFQQ